MTDVVLVTGASGFVGKHLIEALEPSIGSIFAWKRPVSGANWESVDLPQPLSGRPGISWQEVDLLDNDGVAAALDLAKPTLIYHCGGAASVADSWDNTLVALEANVRGTDNLLRAVTASELAPKILVPGSALVYRPSDRAIQEDDPLGPVSPYGLSKLGQEMLAKQYAEENLSLLMTRSFTHIGPGQSVSYAASSFANQIARIEAELTPPVIWVGSLDARRDLTDVRDTVKAYISLMDNGTPGRPYNVCSGRAHRIGDILDGLIMHAKVSVSVKIDGSRQRPSDNQLLLGDPARLQQDVGWKPVIPLSQTLEDLLDYWRQIVS